MGIEQHEVFTLEKAIQTELQKRKITLINGDRKLISKFSKDKTANGLLNFLKIHKSYRVLLNAIVKSNWIDLNAIKKNLKNLLEYSDCSFVYEAACKCGASSDTPTILRKFSENSFKKRISCRDCGEIKLDFSKYSPLFDVSDNSILKILCIGRKKGFLGDNLLAECFWCDSTDQFSKTLKCRNCKEWRNILVRFYPLSPALDELLKDSHGYWLEWYVFEILRRSFPSDFGMLFKENGTIANIDVICLNKKSVWVIECKDTSDISGFLKNAESLKKVGDKVCLLSTHTIDEKSLKAAKKLLGRKFVYVGPKDIEELPNIIKST